MMVNLDLETWTWRPNPGAPTLPMRQYGSFNPGSGVGGAAIHWSGMLWRFMPSDFRYRTHHIERYGAGKLPPGNRIQDWPITYDELEAYYDQFEYDTGAGGIAGNLDGKLIEGGNVFEGPRRREFPLPPLETTIMGGMFQNAAKQMGYHPFPQPSGILSRAYKDVSGRIRSGCMYCGFCTRFGCEVDAKTSGQTTHLPLAMASGRYEVRVNCKVIGINVDASGWATGVTYVDGDGVEHVQPADLVILSAYTLDNVRTLLLSKSKAHPNGVGNDRGMVGKNYTYQHWHTVVKGLFNNQRFNTFMANTATVMLVYDFNGDNFDHSKVDFVGGASLFSGDGENDPLHSTGDLPFGSAGQGSGSTKERSNLSNTWGQKWKDALRKQWDHVASITMQGESLPYEDQFLDLDPIYKDVYGLPLLRLTFDWHKNDYNMYRFLAARGKEIMQKMGPDQVDATGELQPYNIHEYQSTHCTGGAIMGTDPGNSVTNKYGQVWDTPNVFVTGAALYPQNAGANPTGTLGALAYMTGDALVQRYFKQSGRLLE
jgi:gluconate 2-dehydrogenase alpha chain